MLTVTANQSHRGALPPLDKSNLGIALALSGTTLGGTKEENSCPCCRELTKSFREEHGKYIEARHSRFYEVSTQLAAKKQVNMERAKSDLDEHRLTCSSVRERGMTSRRQMQGTPEISELLRELVLLSRTRVDSDSPDNPVQTREARLLQLRMKLVRAIVTQRLSEM